MASSPRTSLRHRRGLTALEITVTIVLVGLLVAVLVPALGYARRSAQRDECADNLRRLGGAWAAYLMENEAFPIISDQPGWRWGGVRFSAVEPRPWVDFNRPISRYVAATGAGDLTTNGAVFHCPADSGITGETAGVGTGSRTAFQSFGTSYRASARLLAGIAVGTTGIVEPVRPAMIQRAPAEVALVGDAGWYETLTDTGRSAAWHRETCNCNLLFLDGSVRFKTVDAASARCRAWFESRLSAAPPSP